MTAFTPARGMQVADPAVLVHSHAFGRTHTQKHANCKTAARPSRALPWEENRSLRASHDAIARFHLSPMPLTRTQPVSGASGPTYRSRACSEEALLPRPPTLSRAKRNLATLPQSCVKPSHCSLLVSTSLNVSPQCHEIMFPQRPRTRKTKRSNKLPHLKFPVIMQRNKCLAPCVCVSLRGSISSDIVQHAGNVGRCWD